MASRDFASQCSLVIAHQQDFLAPGYCNIAIRGEAAYPMMRVGLLGDVTHINVWHARKIWIDGYANQSPFPIVIDRQLHEWCRKQLAVFDDPQSAGLLAHEDTPIENEFKSRAAGQTR